MAPPSLMIFRTRATLNLIRAIGQQIADAS
jgi:hypothetical protein